VPHCIIAVSVLISALLISAPPPPSARIFGDTAVAAAVAGQPRAIAVGDWNGDARLDFAVASTQPDAVEILIGQGNGAYTSAGTLGVGRGPSAIVAADLNDDGKIDLAVTNHDSNDVTILFGDGATFHAGLAISSGGVGPVSIRA